MEMSNITGMFLCLVLALLAHVNGSSHRLVPTTSEVMQCAGQTNQDFSGAGGFQGISNFLANGTKPLIFMIYLPLNNPLNNMAPWVNALRGQLAQYQPNFLGVQLGLWFAQGMDVQVAQGQYDANIQALSQEFEKLGVPVWVRIGYEFNGEWNMYTRTSYPTAFRRITNIFRSSAWGNKYIATVWDYATDAEQSRLNYMDWYPGDDYVDWWGVNIFSGPSAPNSSLVTKFAQDAANRGFPVMLGESTPRYTGVLNGHTSWDTWFSPYFALIGNGALNIRAFCYINWDWSTTRWPNWGDSEIQKNAVVGSNYQKEMSSGRYFNAANKQIVLSKLGLVTR